VRISRAVHGINKMHTDYKKQLIKDVVFIYLLLFISIIFRYFLPHILGNIYFFIILIVSFFSRKEYFWIPFFLLLFSIPGYLFFNGGDYSLPSLNIPSLGREIFYNEFVCIGFIIKALFYKTNTIPLFYKKSLFLILGYSAILMILGFVLGSSLFKVLKTFRYFLPMLLLFAIPKLLFIQEDKVIRFINILFSLVFFCVMAQLIDIIFGRPIASFFGETKIIYSSNELSPDKLVFDVNTKIVRTVYGIFILFISFIASLFYTVSGNNVWGKKYLYVIIALCFLSVFLSATRGWIIAFSVIVLLYLLLFPKNLKISVSGFLIILVLILFSPKIERQITGSFSRFKTMNSLLQGDKTAGGSLERITVRGPRVMAKFKESPIWGFGFSDEYYDFADGHVGNQTLLLNGGIIGYLVYSVFWLAFILGLYKGSLSSKSVYIFIFAFLGLFIIHSSTRIIFSYSLDVENAIGLSSFFAFSNFYLQKAMFKRAELQINKAVV
jgi:hypothetical protein